MGNKSIVATSQSEVGVRRSFKTHHLVGRTLSFVVDQAEADAFNARWCSSSQPGVRRSSKTYHLVGHTLAVVVDQAEADAFIHTTFSPIRGQDVWVQVVACWWDIHTIHPIKQKRCFHR